jgi:hypothetical protein
MASHLEAQLVKLVIWLFLREGGIETEVGAISKHSCTHGTSISQRSYQILHGQDLLPYPQDGR